MDRELERRRRASEPPFGGTTLYTANFLSVYDLRRILSPVVLLLRTDFGEEQLWRLADWHEHDGYLNTAESTAWSSLFAMVESDDALQSGAAQPDTYVRTAFFPSGYAFLLRLYIPAPEDTPFASLDGPDPIPGGVFDLSGNDTLISRVTTAVIGAADGGVLRTETASGFFDSSYSG